MAAYAYALSALSRSSRLDRHRRACQSPSWTLLAATGGAALLTTVSLGFHGLFYLIYFPLALFVAGSSNRKIRVLAGALSLGMIVTWGGLCSQSNARGSGIWGPELVEWQRAHGVAGPHNKLHYDTDVVAGFPFQRIQGHGGGGAPEFLPLSKGLGWFLANLLLSTFVAFLVLSVVFFPGSQSQAGLQGNRRRWAANPDGGFQPFMIISRSRIERWLLVVAALLTLPAYCAGGCELGWMLD